MTNAEIENIGRRPYIKRVLNVTITYDTPPEKIARAEEILKEILAVPEAADPKTFDSQVAPHPNEAINRPDFLPRVYFNDFNPESLNVLVLYWYHPADYWGYLEHARWINLQIMERFNAEGIDFAFPTQTLYLAGDDKRPLTVGQHWLSKEEAFSPSAIPAQAAQTSQTPVSDAARPPVHSTPKDAEERSNAPIEEGLLFSSEQGETGESGEHGETVR
jgi:MscS family membrane protein